MTGVRHTPVPADSIVRDAGRIRAELGAQQSPAAALDRRLAPAAKYVDLAGVRTLYDELGAGQPLVLHPGGVDSRALGPNLDALASRFRVFSPERRGHGHTPDVEGRSPLS